MASAQKKHTQVSKKAAFPCFFLAVHILAAGKKRKEEACSSGEGIGSTDPTGCGQPASSTPLGSWAVGQHLPSSQPEHQEAAQTLVLDEGQHRDPGHSDGSKARGNPSLSERRCVWPAM